MLFDFFSSAFRSRDIQLLIKKIFHLFASFLVFKKLVQGIIDSVESKTDSFKISKATCR